MSIYATLWEIKLPKAHRFDTEWVRVFAQAVPPHIGHPSHYPEGDPYADFLTPVVDCDLKTGLGPFYRAVVILVEGRDEKVGQKYTEPLMMLTGEEYARMPFQELLDRIEQAMPWDPDVAGLSIGANGQRNVIRVPGWMEMENHQRSSARIKAILAQSRTEKK